MTNNNFSPSLEQFVSRLLEEKKLVSLELEVLKQAKEDLLSKAEDKVKAAIFDNIPGDKLEEFSRVMEANDEAKLQSFIQAAVPNLEQVVAQALLEFRTAYLG
ncbi:MAG: DUF5663 domain-containing protein [Patescibacteria group bacterium]